MESNDVEIDILLDWLREGRYGAIRTVYQEVRTVLVLHSSCTDVICQMLDHVKNSPEGFETMIREGIFASDNNNINPLSTEALQTSSQPPAPTILSAPIPSSSAPAAAPVEPMSFAHITSAPTLSADQLGNQNAHRIELTGFRRFASAIIVDQPTSGGSQSGGDASGNFGPSVDSTVSDNIDSSATLRARVQDLRAFFGLEALINGAIDTGSLTDPSGAAPHATPAPLSSIPMDEEARLIPPIIPTPASATVIPQLARRANSTAGADTIPSSVPPPMLASASSQPPASSGDNAITNNVSAESRVSRVCRDCAFEIFLHELYPWWARERARVLALMAAHPLPSASNQPASASSAGTDANATAAIASNSGGSNGTSTYEGQEPSSRDPISEAAARANIDMLVASAVMSALAPTDTTGAGNLIPDDGEGEGEGEVDADGDGVGEDDSDDEGYHNHSGGNSRRAAGLRGGDIIVVGTADAQQQLTARLPEWVASRSNCADGRHCTRQKEMNHAKECEFEPCSFLIPEYLLIIFDFRSQSYYIGRSSSPGRAYANICYCPSYFCAIGQLHSHIGATITHQQHHRRTSGCGRTRY